MTFYPGERAKCPARVARGHGTERCSKDLDLLAPKGTKIEVRVIGGRPKPGEAVQECRRCNTTLGIRLEPVD